MEFPAGFVGISSLINPPNDLVGHKISIIGKVCTISSAKDLIVNIQDDCFKENHAKDYFSVFIDKMIFLDSLTRMLSKNDAIICKDVILEKRPYRNKRTDFNYLCRAGAGSSIVVLREQDSQYLTFQGPEASSLTSVDKLYRRYLNQLIERSLMRISEDSPIFYTVEKLGTLEKEIAAKKRLAIATQLLYVRYSQSSNVRYDGETGDKAIAYVTSYLKADKLSTLDISSQLSSKFENMVLQITVYDKNVDILKQFKPFDMILFRNLEILVNYGYKGPTYTAALRSSQYRKTSIVKADVDDKVCKEIVKRGHKFFGTMRTSETHSFKELSDRMLGISNQQQKPASSSQLARSSPPNSIDSEDSIQRSSKRSSTSLSLTPVKRGRTEHSLDHTHTQTPPPEVKISKVVTCFEKNLPFNYFDHLSDDPSKIIARVIDYFPDDLSKWVIPS